MERRLFLKKALASGAVLSIFNTGLLATRELFATTKEFIKKSDMVTANIDSLPQGSFKFKAPNIAENGAIVPLTVDASNIEGVTNISIVTKNNVIPLSASFDFDEGTVGFASVRIKMAESSPVVALVTAAGETTAIEKAVRVTIGGCGG